jgi:hypothetical protein
LGFRRNQQKVINSLNKLNRSEEYWMTVMQIAMKNNLARIKRCCTIMGRKDENDTMPVA